MFIGICHHVYEVRTHIQPFEGNCIKIPQNYINYIPHNYCRCYLVVFLQCTVQVSYKSWFSKIVPTNKSSKSLTVVQENRNRMYSNQRVIFKYDFPPYCCKYRLEALYDFFFELFQLLINILDYIQEFAFHLEQL